MKSSENYSEDKTAVLTNAILCYGQSATTFHVVEDGVIQPGRAINGNDLQGLFEQGARATPRTWIPPNVLSLGEGSVTWFSPGKSRKMFFKGKPELNRKTFPHPHLIFTADGTRLSVYAYRGRGRPTPDTMLYRAPYWNIYDDGNVCLGDGPWPKAGTTESIDQWEKCFFLSKFSHSNTAAIVKGGHDKLWARLIGKKSFPTHKLIPLNINLGSTL